MIIKFYEKLNINMLILYYLFCISFYNLYLYEIYCMINRFLIIIVTIAIAVNMYYDNYYLSQFKKHKKFCP